MAAVVASSRSKTDNCKSRLRANMQLGLPEIAVL
jgi:hypothetical protein